MAINHKHWKAPFLQFPSWLCPQCQSGTLALNNSSLKFIEPKWSQDAHTHEAWEPSWIVERFSGLLTCQNSACGEVVAIGGRTHQIENHDWETQKQNWDRAFEPTFIIPAPPVFPIPEKCPEVIKNELTKAFSLFWPDAGACANRLRSTVEALLNDKKIQRTTLNNKRKREPLSLHSRIEKYKKIDAETANFLLAIKWLGNAGSHANFDDPSRNELLDGFELVEYAIERVYLRREERLTKMAKKVNHRKGRSIKHRKPTF